MMRLDRFRTKNLKKTLLCLLTCIAVIIGCVAVMSITAGAESSISVDINSGEATDQSSTLDLLFLLAFIALIPSFLIMMTCFTRIIISLSFLRTALGTNTSPSNQVLIGIAIFLTLFIMFPTLTEINESAYKPYKEGELTQEEFMDTAVVPLKTFMLKQVYDEDLDLFLSLADEQGALDMSTIESQEDLLDLSLLIITPAFMTSELKRGFLIGFLLYIPFLIIDLVVSSTLMSMGMMMLPPTMISTPFKIMLFILADGWNLLFESLIVSFH